MLWVRKVTAKKTHGGALKKKLYPGHQNLKYAIDCCAAVF